MHKLKNLATFQTKVMDTKILDLDEDHFNILADAYKKDLGFDFLQDWGKEDRNLFQLSRAFEWEEGDPFPETIKVLIRVVEEIEERQKARKVLKGIVKESEIEWPTTIDVKKHLIDKFKEGLSEAEEAVSALCFNKSLRTKSYLSDLNLHVIHNKLLECFNLFKEIGEKEDENKPTKEAKMAYSPAITKKDVGGFGELPDKDIGTKMEFSESKEGTPKNKSLEEECEEQETDIYIRGYNAGKKDGLALERKKQVLDKLMFGIYDAENAVSEHLKKDGLDHYSRDYLLIHAKLMECIKLHEKIMERKNNQQRR